MVSRRFTFYTAPHALIASSCFSRRSLTISISVLYHFGVGEESCLLSSGSSPSKCALKMAVEDERIWGVVES